MGGCSVIGERIIPEEFRVAKTQYLLYLRHLFAYDFTVRNLLGEKSTVLEVGCGSGYGTHLISKKAGKVIGLDVDRKAIEYTTGKYGSGNCRFSVYDGRTIPYADKTFDAVVSFQVIEHVDEDLNYAAEAYRVLKTGGLLILTTPNKTYRLKPGQKPWNRYHKREYYPEELENVLRSKFSDIMVWGIQGSEEIQSLEKEKYKNVSALGAFLRRAVPESVKLALIRMGRKIPWRSERESGFIDKYSISDYYVIKEGVWDSLDLLAVCRK